MRNLLKLQLRNLFHNKLFYVCLGLTLLSPILDFIAELVLPNIPSLSETIFENGFTYTKVFPQLAEFMNSAVGLVSKVFIALFCCLEFTEGNVKNIIARGYTRTQYLLSKYIATLIGLFTMYIITIVVIFVLFIKNGLGYDSSLVYPLIIDIFEIIALTTMFSTISLLLERNATAIVACLFIPIGATLLLTVCDTYLKLGISDYWIENISMIYTKNPGMGNLWLSLLYYVIYILFFMKLGNYLFKKKEIK